MKKSHIILNLIMILMCIIFIAPFILLLSISFSNEQDIAMYGYEFIPRHFNFDAYTYIFKNPSSILNAYKVTIISSAVGTFLSVFMMAMVAYPLSRKDLKGRGIISFYLFFTMLFNGGMVPTFILITQYLHLDDKIWVYIIPGLINVWHIFLMRTFFAQLPFEIIESAYIDGAGEWRIFFTMVLPLSKPVLATVALLGVLARWNDWLTATLYITDDKLVSLQYLLQRILNDIQLLQNSSTNISSIDSIMKIPAETVRMAMSVIAAGPILVVFPFFQKYFVKGLTVGSVKG